MQQSERYGACACAYSVQKPECSALAEGSRQPVGKQEHLRRRRADRCFAHVAVLRVVRPNNAMRYSATVKCEKWQKLIQLAMKSGQREHAQHRQLCTIAIQ